MAELVLQTRSAELASLTATLETLRERLRDLDRLPGPEEVADMSLQQQYFLYEHWAEGRRQELNCQIAALEGQRLYHLAEARRAFARTEVLRKLS